MRIAISGITSYTGACIAEALALAGHQVHGLARGALESYTERKRLRLARAAAAGVDLVGGLAAETGAMRDWTLRQELDVWIQHHHPMENYRSPHYDIARIRPQAIESIRSLVAALGMGRARLLVYSGTYFEPGEGGHGAEARVSPYAALKHELSIELQRQCGERGLRFAKVILPWPCGALENDDRLTPRLIETATQRRVFALQSPGSIMDVLPGEACGASYERVIAQMTRDSAPASAIVRPSGRVTSTLDWVEFVRTRILHPLGLSEGLQLAVPPPSEQLVSTSYANPANERIPIDWDEFGARYAREWISLASTDH